MIIQMSDAVKENKIQQLEKLIANIKDEIRSINNMIDERITTLESLQRTLNDLRSGT